MVTCCNILYDTEFKDSLLFKKYRHKTHSPVKFSQDITELDTMVPTLVYGYKLAKSIFGDMISQTNRRINNHYYWSYNPTEMEKEDWSIKFVDTCIRSWLSCNKISVDVVFGGFFDVKGFIDKLGPYPMIVEGNFEIYVGDWSEKEVTVYSIQKQAFEYVDTNPQDVLTNMYTWLDNKFLTYDTKKFYSVDSNKNRNPVFVDELLFANSDVWIGIPEIHSIFEDMVITHNEVITYYLQRSECYREKFTLYQ